MVRDKRDTLYLCSFDWLSSKMNRVLFIYFLFASCLARQRIWLPVCLILTEEISFEGKEGSGKRFSASRRLKMVSLVNLLLL